MLPTAMTILSRSAVQPDVLTAQCDVCFPQFIATTSLAVLRDRRWLLRELGDDIDMCPHCRFEPAEGRETRIARAARMPADQGFLPNLIMIGTAKAGTTSLHSYLDQHPDMFLSEDKELRYFCDPDCAEWLPLYRERFPVDAPIRGESTTLYTRSPAIPGVAERMAALVPDARLVYLVRDPVARALASWREERHHLTEMRSAPEAFAHPEDPTNPYVAASRYAEQLELFLAHYPADRILVLDQAELAASADTVVRRVVDFLGLPPADIDTGTRLNEGTTKLEYGGLGQRVRESAPARAVRRMPAPVRDALTAPARRFLRRPIETPDLPEELMERMRAVLAPDAARLRELTGMTFAHWTV